MNPLKAYKGGNAFISCKKAESAACMQNKKHSNELPPGKGEVKPVGEGAST
jgi:hypothetical protein